MPESTQILLIAILLLAFLFTISKNYRETLHIYTAQTLAIFGIMLLNGQHDIFQDAFLIISILIGIGLRVFFMPKLIGHFLLKEQFHMMERDFKIPVFGSLLLELGIFIFTYTVVRNIFGRVDLIYFVSLILIFFGFVTSFNHKKLFSNILSLLMIENGLFLLSVFMLGSIPFFMELGIMVDIVFGFLVSIIALTHIKSIDETISIDSMQDLKEAF